MSDQEVGAGHQLTTMHAVRHLFERMPGETHLGLSPQNFFEKLDHAQAKADGFPLGGTPYGNAAAYVKSGGVHENTAWGSGATMVTSTLAPGAQAQHALGNPYKSAQESVADIRHLLVRELMAAKACHERGDVNGEFAHLGKVAHCVEDSYSQAHMFRDPTRPGDPEAPIKAVLNFSYNELTNTHNEKFDSVPKISENNDLARSTDQAGAEALGRVLTLYMHTLGESNTLSAKYAFAKGVEPFFNDHDAIKLDSPLNPEFHRQTHEHQENEQSLTPVTPDPPEQAPSISHPDLSSMNPETTEGADAVSINPPPADDQVSGNPGSAVTSLTTTSGDPGVAHPESSSMDPRSAAGSDAASVDPIDSTPVGVAPSLAEPHPSSSSMDPSTAEGMEAVSIDPSARPDSNLAEPIYSPVPDHNAVLPDPSGSTPSFDFQLNESHFGSGVLLNPPDSNAHTQNVQSPDSTQSAIQDHGTHATPFPDGHVGGTYYSPAAVSGVLPDHSHIHIFDIQNIDAAPGSGVLLDPSQASSESLHSHGPVTNSDPGLSIPVAGERTGHEPSHSNLSEQTSQSIVGTSVLVDPGSGVLLDPSAQHSQTEHSQSYDAMHSASNAALSHQTPDHAQSAHAQLQGHSEAPVLLDPSVADASHHHGQDTSSHAALAHSSSAIHSDHGQHAHLSQSHAQAGHDSHHDPSYANGDPAILVDPSAAGGSHHDIASTSHAASHSAPGAASQHHDASVMVDPSAGHPAGQNATAHHDRVTAMPDPANGRFHTAEEFRHANNQHQLQLHPEMLLSGGPVQEQAGHSGADRHIQGPADHSAVLSDPAHVQPSGNAGHEPAANSEPTDPAAANDSPHAANQPAVLVDHAHSHATAHEGHHATAGSITIDPASAQGLHHGADQSAVLLDPAQSHADSHGGHDSTAGAVSTDASSTHGGHGHPPADQSGVLLDPAHSHATAHGGHEPAAGSVAVAPDSSVSPHHGGVLVDPAHAHSGHDSAAGSVLVDPASAHGGHPGADHSAVLVDPAHSSSPAHGVNDHAAGSVVIDPASAHSAHPDVDHSAAVMVDPAHSHPGAAHFADAASAGHDAASAHPALVHQEPHHDAAAISHH